MPLVDKSSEELRKYQGSSPCPKEIDEFWDASLSEMSLIDPEVELMPADFQVECAECFDLFFTGIGGARIHAKYLRPKNVSEPVPAVLQFHGYSGNCGEWNDKLAYVSSGYAVAALDCRGQAGLSEDVGGVKGNTFRGQIIRGLDDDGPEKLLFRSIFLDTARLADIVMGFDEVDETRVAAIGGSQGGGLTLVCASLNPKINSAASTFPFLCDYRRVWEMDLAQGAYEELKTYFRQFDPRHERENEVFERLGYIDVQNITKRIKAKILMGTGLMDQTCPPSTQFAAYNKITSEKNVLIYPDFGHEGLPGFADAVYQFMMDM
ncbi:MAG: acetylxylan esterase [Victivallales bacterium]|nr:acetylxylan esterase [Victivallales bacterium]